MSVRTGHCPHAAYEPTFVATEGAEVAARQGVLSALCRDQPSEDRHQATAGTGTAA